MILTTFFIAIFWYFLYNSIIYCYAQMTEKQTITGRVLSDL